MKKEHDLSDLSPKKNQKVLMKIDTMVDVFLNTANFAQHAFYTLATPAILISKVTEKYLLTI